MKVTFNDSYGLIEFNDDKGNQVRLPKRFLAMVDGLLVVVVRTVHKVGNSGHGMGEAMQENITFTHINDECNAISMDDAAKKLGFEPLCEVQ